MADKYDNLKNTPLIEAIRAGHLSNAEELISAGADVNEPGGTRMDTVELASGKGDQEMATLLVDKGADVFKVGRDQRTPYMIALAAGHASVVKFLRQAEDLVEGDKPNRPERKYCKAFVLKDLRQYPGWFEAISTGKKIRPMAMLRALILDS